MTRLDKLVSDKLNITRKEAKALIKSGAVNVGGKAAASGDIKCGECDEITVNGKPLDTRRFVYIMMNKPKGVICATDGKGEKTVLDLLPEDMRRKGLFPAGRLDKDTTGFVLITDDGDFAHSILSPSKHVKKTYIAILDKPVNNSIISDFEGGMTLGEEKLLPAKLTVIENCTVQVEISQGIYHQIKRMFSKHRIEVVELKRTKIGVLELDEKLAEGECRYIQSDEIDKMCKK
ncbi:MAG: 16S rRNA pseudouridine(516) synthase [Eubacterium sp.]|nr:16S rRNA pseudouridine(516) synthase [Eubacterium sp.]